MATSGLSAESGVKSGASVNAVTKSGTNRFTGTGFEFLRDRRFNAPEHFAAFGPDGKQKDDGLRRNQFGGTLGGPIFRDRLFFFGGYQGTVRRQVPTSQILYVPTAQMLAGDFTAVTSPACAGRQITLRGPFVNSRTNPALFSPAALNIAAKLPQTTDPCGEVQWETVENEDVHQPITRIDYQATNNQLIFGRYLLHKRRCPHRGPAQATTSSRRECRYRGHAPLAGVGHTQVVSASVVNAVRFTYNATDSHRFQNPGFFGPADVGIKVYPYPPDEASQFGITVSNSFSTMSAAAQERRSTHKLPALADDVTLVRGSHQLGFGANVGYWKFDTRSTGSTGGKWEIDGSATGHALADFLTGRVARIEIAGARVLDIHNWYRARMRRTRGACRTG